MIIIFKIAFCCILVSGENYEFFCSNYNMMIQRYCLANRDVGSHLQFIKPYFGKMDTKAGRIVHIYGKDIRETYKGLKKNKKGLVLTDIFQINDLINKRLSNNDYLMVKGSNSTGLNRYSKKLKLNRYNAL